MKPAPSFYGQLESLIEHLNSGTERVPLDDEVAVRSFCQAIERLGTECIVEAEGFSDAGEFDRAHEATERAARLSAAGVTSRDGTAYASATTARSPQGRLRTE